MRVVYWTGPIAWLMLPIYVIGAVSAVLIVLRRLFGRGKVSGEVESQIYYPELRVLETRIRVDNGWPGHRAGQTETTRDRHLQLIGAGNTYALASADQLQVAVAG
eukprot:gene51868-70678_t